MCVHVLVFVHVREREREREREEIKDTHTEKERCLRKIEEAVVYRSSALYLKICRHGKVFVPPESADSMLFTAGNCNTLHDTATHCTISPLCRYGQVFVPPESADCM